MSSILYLRRDEVRALCQRIEDPCAAVHEVLVLHAQGQTVLPDEAYLRWDSDGWGPARSLNMPGFLGGHLRVAGTKIINANPSNPRRSLPRASGLIALFDDATARVTCLMEASTISALRTACVSAICAGLFRENDAEELAIIGAGVLAEAHLELLLSRLQGLRAVRIHDTERERALALRQRFQVVANDRGVEIEVVDDAEYAVRGAQLVVVATTVTEGYLELEWLERGCLLMNVSLDDPMPEVVMQADLLVVDDWGLVRADSRRLLGRMYRAGLIVGPGEDRSATRQAREVDAELGHLLLDHRSQTRRNELVVVNPFGMSLEDLAVATRVHDLARDLGVGTTLPV